MTNTITHNIQKVQSAISQSTFKRIVSALSVSVGVLFVGYIYLVGALTFSVIEQKNVEQNLKKTTAAIGNVELAYLATSRSLTKDYAKSLGFVETPQIAYTDMAHGLAINTN